MIVGKGVLQGDCLSAIVKVLLRLYYHVTGFNLLMIRLSQHQLKKTTICSYMCLTNGVIEVV